MPEMTKQERRLAIWRDLTPEQRDYDRFIAGVIPQGASWLPETEWGRSEGRTRLNAMTGESSCRCHINSPCSYCESLEECETCGAWIPRDDMDDHASGEHVILTAKGRAVLPEAP